MLSDELDFDVRTVSADGFNAGKDGAVEFVSAVESCLSSSTSIFLEIPPDDHV